MAEKKPYTIVYGASFNHGSRGGSITRFARVETDNLKELLNEDPYAGNTWFVFEGHPRLEGEQTPPVTEQGPLSKPPEGSLTVEQLNYMAFRD